MSALGDLPKAPPGAERLVLSSCFPMLLGAGKAPGPGRSRVMDHTALPSLRDLVGCSFPVKRIGDDEVLSMLAPLVRKGEPVRVGAKAVPVVPGEAPADLQDAPLDVAVADGAAVAGALIGPGVEWQRVAKPIPGGSPGHPLCPPAWTPRLSHADPARSLGRG